MLVEEYLGVDPSELHVVWEGLGTKVFRPNVLGVIYVYEFITSKVEVVIWLVRELEIILSHHQ